MSKSGCSPSQNENSTSSSCAQRFEVMDELNRHYTERIRKIEKAGHTELLVCNLKKWIDSLVTHDKVLIKTIESLESEALKRSEKITKLCKERSEVEEIYQKYKEELCQKAELIKDLNCRIKEQAETLNQKECLIKKLNDELKQLKESLDKLKKQNEKQCGESEQSLLDMRCELDNLKKEIGKKECKINNLEEELCKCRRELEEVMEKSQHIRYNGRANELELKLERAREEICCLRKKLESKEAEITSMRESKYDSQDINKIDKVIIPDSMLSLKIEEFQRFTDESNKKLEETMHEIKQHAGNLLLKEELDDINCFLNAEQETFVKANRQLHVLFCNIKNTNPSLAMPANYKLQCIGNKLKSALDEVEKERSPDSNCALENRDLKKKFLDSLIVKIRESLKIVCDLKQDAPQAAESSDPVSTASSTKLIQEMQEMIKTIQNQSKIQQSRLFATLDNQKEETTILCKKFSEVDYLLKSQCKSINYVKDELKMALCNITQKAEKVRKQAEGISHFACSIKEISNWVNQNVKNNSEVMSKICILQNNLQQIMSMKTGLDDSKKEGRNSKMIAYRQTTGQSQSTPELGFTDSQGPDLNDFEDKCIVARELCDEVKSELEKAASRINERELKLTQLSREMSCFGDTMSRLQEDIMKSVDILSGDYAECSDEFSTYDEVTSHLHDSNNQLMKALNSMKHKLINHHKEAEIYEKKGMELKKVITIRLNELEEALNNISEFLGEIKENDYIKSKRALSSDSMLDEEEVMESDMSIIQAGKMRSLQRHLTDSTSCGVDIEVQEDSSFSNENQIITPSCLIKELKSEICSLNETITSLHNQNKSQEEKIKFLKCQLINTKEEADKTIRTMLSSLQEKCQPMEPLVDECEINKLTSENLQQRKELTELKAVLQAKCEKVNMMKKEYLQLTQEINQLTGIVQEEKINSKKRECNLNKENAELKKEISWMKERLQDACQKLGSQQNEDSNRDEIDEAVDEYKKKLHCVQDNYTTLLNQYRELCRNHDNLKRVVNRSLDQRPREELNMTTEGYEQITQKYSTAMKEINTLRSELKHLNCEYERLNAENQQLTKERNLLEKEVERIQCEQEEIVKNSDEKENLLSELKQCEEEIKCLKDEYTALCKNNELLVIENDDLKTELECVSEKYGVLDGKLKDLLDRYTCMRNENDKLHMDKLKMQKEMSEQSEKSKILRDEDCRENLSLKQKYDEVKQELKCAEFKIEELEAEVSKVEKRNLETAILEADTQLLITKTDQEWNEMYVKKCTEVMELTEEVECLRKKILGMNEQLLERSELSNQSKRVIAMMKKTLQDYKTQIVCLKNKLEKCITWNRDMKRQVAALEKSNRSMKQFICFLNKEKNGLLDKINQLQSEGSYTYDDSIC